MKDRDAAGRALGGENGQSPILTAELDIDHVAHLARLELTPDEKSRMAGQLVKILDYVGHLQELDTEGIEATFQVMPRVNLLRPDETRPGLSTDDALSNAPQREGSYFRLPRILEEESGHGSAPPPRAGPATLGRYEDETT